MKYPSPGSGLGGLAAPGRPPPAGHQVRQKLTNNDLTQTGPPSGLMSRITG